MSKISIQDLKDEMALLEKKLTVVKLMIHTYSENETDSFYYDPDFEFQSKISETTEVPYDDFPYHKKWIEQILYLLNKKNRFLNNHELAESLLPYYTEYNIDKLKRKVSVNISGAYKKQSVEGLIKVRINNMPKGNVWGYKKWLSADGEILKKHRPFESSDSGQMTIY